MKQMESMRPLFKTLEFFGFKYLGLSPNPILPKKRFNYRAWRDSLKYLSIYGTMLMITMIINITYLYPNIPFVLTVNNIAITSLFSMNLFLMIIVPRFFLQGDMIRVFKIFQQIDFILKLPPSFFVHCLHSSWILIISYGICIPGLLIMVGFSGYQSFGILSLYHVFIALNTIIQEFPLAILLYFTVVIYERFRVVNTFLPLIGTDKVYSVRSMGFFRYMYPETKEPSSILNCVALKQLLKCHDKLTDICDLVNGIFGYIMLLRTLAILGITSYWINLWLNLTSSHNENFAISDSELAPYFPYVMFAVFVILSVYTYFLSLCCVLAANEGNKTKQVIARILSRHEAKDEVIEDLKLYLEICKARSVEFTQAGFGEIDSQLTWRFLSSVITFILLIKQFQ